MSKEKQIEGMTKFILELDTYNCEECDKCDKWQYEDQCDDVCFSKKVAEALYNAGYRKQKHGTWYHGTENGVVYARCSACGRKMNYSCYGYAYCSLCGARMDGAE